MTDSCLNILEFYEYEYGLYYTQDFRYEFDLLAMELYDYSEMEGRQSLIAKIEDYNHLKEIIETL